MEIREITPDEAYDMLSINTRNRPMNKNLVLEYARQMKEGLWQLNGEPIIISDGNVLLDGQHRLAAIKKSNVSQKMIIIKGVDGDAFKTIDTGKTRTAGDIFALNGIPNANRISAGISRYFFLKNKSVAYIHSPKSIREIKVSKSEILDFYIQNESICRDIYISVSACVSKISLIATGPTMGLFLYLVVEKKHSIDKVADFFNQLFFDTNITNSTIPLLRDKLLKDKIGQYKLTSDVRHGLIVKTWNCFVSGKQMKVLSYNLKNEQNIDFI